MKELNVENLLIQPAYLPPDFLKDPRYRAPGLIDLFIESCEKGWPQAGEFYFTEHLQNGQAIGLDLYYFVKPFVLEPSEDFNPDSVELRKKFISSEDLKTRFDNDLNKFVKGFKKHVAWDYDLTLSKAHTKAQWAFIPDEWKFFEKGKFVDNIKSNNRYDNDDYQKIILGLHERGDVLQSIQTFCQPNAEPVLKNQLQTMLQEKCFEIFEKVHTGRMIDAYFENSKAVSMMACNQAFLKRKDVIDIVETCLADDDCTIWDKFWKMGITVYRVHQPLSLEEVELCKQQKNTAFNEHLVQIDTDFNLKLGIERLEPFVEDQSWMKRKLVNPAKVPAANFGKRNSVRPKKLKFDNEKSSEYSKEDGPGFRGETLK